MIVICEKYFDIVLFPFGTVDVVHLTQIPLFTEAKNTYDENFNSLNQPGILVIFEFLHILTSENRKRITIRKLDCISNYSRDNLKCSLLDTIKKDLTEELERMEQQQREMEQQ